MQKKCYLLAIPSICIISHAQAPVEMSEKDRMAFSQMLSMGSDYSEYAARRKSAGKVDEFSVLYNFLGKYLNLSPAESEQVMIISTEYGNEINDLNSECRYWEIVLLNRGGKNTLGPASWTVHGFPVDYLKRREEILIKHINKLKLAFGETKFKEFKTGLYYKMSKFYGDVLTFRNKTR
jgi:hypothetical protein